MLRFDGRVVLVTGAARGLGAGYALYLADLGAHVVVNDLGVTVDGSGRSPQPADAFVDELRSGGGAATADDADVSCPEEAAALVDRIMRQFGNRLHPHWFGRL